LDDIHRARSLEIGDGVGAGGGVRLFGNLRLVPLIMALTALELSVLRRDRPVGHLKSKAAFGADGSHEGNRITAVLML
jgi:hypothetical protein